MDSYSTTTSVSRMGEGSNSDDARRTCRVSLPSMGQPAGPRQGPQSSGTRHVRGAFTADGHGDLVRARDNQQRTLPTNATTNGFSALPAKRRLQYSEELSVEDILDIFNVPRDGATSKNMSDGTLEAVPQIQNHGDFWESDIYFSPFFKEDSPRYSRVPAAQQTTPASQMLLGDRSSHSREPVPTRWSPEACRRFHQDFEPSLQRDTELPLQTRSLFTEGAPMVQNELPQWQTQEIPRKAQQEEQYSPPRQPFSNESFSQWRPSVQYDHPTALESRGGSTQTYSTRSCPPTRQQDGYIGSPRNMLTDPSERFPPNSGESLAGSERFPPPHPRQPILPPPGLSYPFSRQEPQGPRNNPEYHFYGRPPSTQRNRQTQDSHRQQDIRPPPVFMSPRPAPRNLDPNASSWEQVYRIYGTALAILIKSIDFSAQSQANTPQNKFSQGPNPFFIDNFFEQNGLPGSTHNLLNLYNTDVNFQRHGEIVLRGERRRKDLKAMLKTSVEAKLWPGDVEFSELRQGLEVVRRKAATDLLDKYGDLFDKDWENYRSRQNNNRSWR